MFYAPLAMVFIPKWLITAIFICVAIVLLIILALLACGVYYLSQLGE